MQLSLIYAKSRNGVIGKDGDMPWGRALPEDLAHFKSCTWGHSVIMGRKTWLSLPPKLRPLPGRRNLVLSRDPDFLAPGAEVADSLLSALTMCRQDCEVWVIGGGQLYHEALPLAQKIIVTEIDADFAGDTYAPTLPNGWYASHTAAWQTAASGLRYRIVRFEKTSLCLPKER